MKNYKRIQLVKMCDIAWMKVDQNRSEYKNIRGLCPVVDAVCK